MTQQNLLNMLFVRISEKVELRNFELSDGFCEDLIVNVHGTEKFA